MRTLVTAAVLVMTLTLAVAAPVSASEARPMRGSFEGTVFLPAPRCGSDLTVGFGGAGNATHFGQLTGAATNCTLFSLGTDAVPVYDGEATFTAADGSAVLTTYEGVQAAPVAGVATYSTTITVVGGTGRFADADGVWLVTGTLDFTTGSIDGHIDGWLAY
jgi:hypothetical protein